MSVANPAQGAPASGPGRRRGRRVVKIALLSAAVLLAVVVSGGYLTSERLAGQIHRYAGVFAGLDGQARPPATGATTFLFVGNDSLSPNRPADDLASDGSVGGQSGDLIMVVRIEPGYSTATAVSLPVESLVDLPGRGTAKLESSYSLGGPSVLIQTIEDITGLRIDHFVVIDFAGLRALTDTVGGIDVNITQLTSPGVVPFRSGPNHLDGAQLLAYLREPAGADGVEGGDLGRVRRQQNALRALLVKTGRQDLLAHPVRAYEFFDTLTRWIGVDDTLSNADLRTLVWRLRELRPEGITFLTAPVTTASGGGTGSPSPRLDTARGTELWQAVGDGDPGRYLEKYPADS